MRGIGRILPLAAGLMLLTACGEAAEPVQEALEFRTALLSADACAFTAQVTADMGERVYEFTLDCGYDPETNGAALTVTAPEAIAGIAATVDGEASSVAFDGVALELGTLAGGRLAPLELPQVLGEAWAYGYVESQAQEGDGWLVTYRSGYDDEELLVLTAFDGGMVPLRAEVYADGVLALSAELAGFSAA